MGVSFRAALVFFLSLSPFFPAHLFADSVSDTSIVFVTMVPNPRDFGTQAATFGNHVANPDTAFRGGDLWIRYPDGSLRNLTQAAGYGNTGFQGASAIAVRDPAPYWDGSKILFSMVIGAPTQQYQLTSHRWQLYEMTNLNPDQTPVVTKVANQPSNYNNVQPTYATDDSIIFSSDRPRDDTVLHTYPQRDEYESAAVTTGLWKLIPSSGSLSLLDHSPSGDFNPTIDSYGRVIFTRWDHLQRDQQNIGASLGAYNYESETSTTATSSNAEVFPEPRSNQDPDKKANVNLFTINQFFPWVMNQDGTDLETLNHIGRQEVGLYVERSFNDDPNVQEFYGQYSAGVNQNEFTIFLHIKEDPAHPGNYLGTNCQEFATHSAGQLISIEGPPGMNPDAMRVTYLTHPDTAGASGSPSGNHSGLYRDPLPLSNGKLLAVHTAETREDSNVGSSSSPQSRYDFRLKALNKPGTYYSGGTNITSGISKSVSFWSPDSMISYNGTLWEVSPIELRVRTRPQANSLTVPAIEAGVISSMGVSMDELTNYLRSQNLALVISRNLTTRDKNDRQQPTNLRVTGTQTQSLPKSGKIYDISFMDFFQGDLLRSYSNGNNSGRRVLAQRMHSVGVGINPPISGQPEGVTQIAEDGSMAAFVPARRALSWQMSDPQGNAVVRERYWVTFQPGEIRVCASCHGVNSSDHLGNGAPTNPPLALARLLAHWKELPPPPFVPTPVPPGNGPPSSPTAIPTTVPGGYSLKVKVSNPKENARFTAEATLKESDKASLAASVNGMSCKGTKSFKGSGTTRKMQGKLPKLSGAKVKLFLRAGSKSQVKANVTITMTKSKKRRSTMSKAAACKDLLASLR